MKSIKNLIPAAAFLAAMFSGSAALAHSDEYLDTQKTPNGGQMRMAGVYHFELVVAKDSKEPKDNPVIVYLTDHAGTKIPTTGATGTVTILGGKTKLSVTLAPDGENRLRGTGKYASTPDMKAVVSIALPGKTPEQARFTPLTAVKDEHTEHTH